MGITGGVMGTVASGVRGAAGARATTLSAVVGALAGRGLLPALETNLLGGRRLRGPQSAEAQAAVAYSRPLCEAAAAATGVLLLRRALPTTRPAELHLRAVRAALVGAMAGHAVSRLACRHAEVQHAREAATRSASVPGKS